MGMPHKGNQGNVHVPIVLYCISLSGSKMVTTEMGSCDALYNVQFYDMHLLTVFIQASYNRIFST